MVDEIFPFKHLEVLFNWRLPLVTAIFNFLFVWSLRPIYCDQRDPMLRPNEIIQLTNHIRLWDVKTNKQIVLLSETAVFKDTNLETLFIIC